jgi:hypothetical protein
MSKTSKINKRTPARILFEGFENDILYDCHGLSARVSRSEFRALMLKRGPEFLRHIRKYLLSRFPKGGPHEEGPDPGELCIAWMLVLYDFLEKYRQLRKFSPYSSKVPFGEQRMTEWSRFCYLATR